MNLVVFEYGYNSAGQLLQLFRDGAPRTKADLLEITGLSRSTLANRIEELQAARLLVSVGSAPSTGGRPATRLAFNPDVGEIVAIDLGATHLSVAITNLNADVRTSRTANIDVADGPTKVLDFACELALQLLKEHRVTKRLMGIGVGVPARVEFATGRPIDPPIMPGWDRFDIPGYIRRRFAVPVVVDNDVNILALGEHSLVWPTVSELIYVKVATGLGAGIIANGALQRGAQGSAGDLGHVRVQSNRTIKVLGRVASGTAIAEQLRSKGLEVAASNDVAALLRAGNTTAIAATHKAGRAIGEALITAVNLLNPSVVVLGGSIGRAGNALLAGVREVVYEGAVTQATEHLQIVQSTGGETSAVRGAAMMVSQLVLAPASIEQRLR